MGRLWCVWGVSGCVWGVSLVSGGCVGGVRRTNRMTKTKIKPIWSYISFSPSAVQLVKSTKTIKIFRPMVRG